MKSKIILFVLLLLQVSVFGQGTTNVPNAFQYQAVIRNSSGQPITNLDLGVQITIIQGIVQGTNVYQEIHQTESNGEGLFTLIIGGGEVFFGNLGTIEWSNGPYFLEVVIDQDNQGNPQLFGTTQLLSVPYALYATRSGNSDDNVWISGTGAGAIVNDNGSNNSATGNFSVAAGNDVFASGDGAFAEGTATLAGGAASHAEGFVTRSVGDYSHAEGEFSAAFGYASHAQNSGATANGDYSTAMGLGTIAQSFAETVIGAHNTLYQPVSDTSWAPTDRLFVIGNSPSFNQQSNAITVLKNGNLGLGIDAPTVALDVTGAIRTDTTCFATAFSSNSPLKLQTGGVDRIYVKDTDGKTGIGTTDPEEILHVIENDTISTMALGKTGSGNVRCISIVCANTGDIVYKYVNAKISDVANSTFIRTNTAYNSWLTQVLVDSSDVAVGGGTYDILWAPRGTGNISWTSRMHINQDGNMGIGTTSPSEKLEVDGVVRSNNAFNVSGDEGVSGTFNFNAVSSGDVSQMTISGGIVTSVTTLP